MVMLFLYSRVWAERWRGRELHAGAWFRSVGREMWQKSPQLLMRGLIKVRMCHHDTIRRLIAVCSACKRGQSLLLRSLEIKLIIVEAYNR